MPQYLVNKLELVQTPVVVEADDPTDAVFIAYVGKQGKEGNSNVIDSFFPSEWKVFDEQGNEVETKLKDLEILDDDEDDDLWEDGEELIELTEEEEQKLLEAEYREIARVATDPFYVSDELAGLEYY